MYKTLTLQKNLLSEINVILNIKLVNTVALKQFMSN